MSSRLNRLSRWAMSLLLASSVFACVAIEADVPTEPTVTFPAWSADHNQTASVKVKPAEGWTIASVEYSIDGVKWSKAEGPAPAAAGAAVPADGTPYTVTLDNLDIGDSELTLKVTSSYRGQTEVDYFYSEISGVQPVFDCAAASIAPSADMVRNVDTEQRTLMGYFGQPEGGHTVTASISFVSINQNAYENVGRIVSQGSDSLTVSFDVREATCDTGNGPNNWHDCDTPYTLTLWVDGAEICSQQVGNIHTYWDGNGRGF